MKTRILFCIALFVAPLDLVYAETDILGGILKAITQPATQPSNKNSAQPRNRMATNQVQLYYCTGLNRSTQEYAFAMAVFPTHLRSKFMPWNQPINGSVQRCSDNVRQQMCNKYIIGLAGTFLTAGRPGGAAVGTATNAAGAQQSVQLLGAVAGGIVGGLWQNHKGGTMGDVAKGGVVGGAAGYGAGTGYGYKMSHDECDRHKQAWDAVAQYLNGRLVSNDMRSLQQFFDTNVITNPGQRVDIENMKADAQKLASIAATALQ